MPRLDAPLYSGAMARTDLATIGPYAGAEPVARVAARRAVPVLLALVLAGAAAAQIPVGSEIQLNSYTTSGQYTPDVSIAADGSFVVVWDSFQGAVNDDFNAVNGRRFSPSGSPLGSDFQVNTYTTDSQSSPAVAVAPGGSFVVVWENAEYTGSYPIDDVVGIRARLYDASGSGGGDIPVNEAPDQGVYNPDVAMDGSGNFVVVWEGSYAHGDGYGVGILGQRFSTSGTPLGSNFQVNTETLYSQTYPSVDVDSSGSFVVVWQSFDGSNYGVRARRFAANGASQGNDFAVNTLTLGFQGRADVAMDPNGGFTVVWDGFDSNGTDSDPFSIQGRRYGALGSPIGVDFQVNTYTTTAQGKSRIATTSLGTLVVWESGGSAGTDTGVAVNSSVQRRGFLPSWQARGDDEQVNSYTPSFQWRPAVAMNESGQVVVVWESGSILGSPDGDSSSIQGQRFLMPIFTDGFESGNVAAWSSSSP